MSSIHETPRDCSRAWQAEAILDGRLTGDGRASFGAHAQTCRACALERRALHRLAALARGHVGAEAGDLRVPTELARRRTRAELLTRANDEATLRGGARGRPRTLLVSFAVAAALSGFAFAATHRNRGATTAPVVAASATRGYEVDALADARWTDASTDETTRVVMSAGTATFQVATVRAPRRFVVTLPDGEIEVKGTRFLVAIEGDATQRVVVLEGVVALRLRGLPERALVAGERWTREQPIVSAVTADTRGAPKGTDGDTKGTSGDPKGTTRPEDAAGERFTATMRAFKEGRYAEADALLSAFAAAFPADARREDCLFLCAVAQSRLGHRALAASRANDYLAAYPHGFKSAQAERLASGGE